MVDWQEKERFQCSFEEAIRDIPQKEPPIQTLVKSNLTKFFDLNTKSQFFEFIKSINFTISTSFIGDTRRIGSTKDIGIARFIKNTRPIDFLFILEDITQQLLESEHSLTLG